LFIKQFLLQPISFLAFILPFLSPHPLGLGEAGQWASGRGAEQPTSVSPQPSWHPPWAQRSQRTRCVLDETSSCYTCLVIPPAALDRDAGVFTLGADVGISSHVPVLDPFLAAQ